MYVRLGGWVVCCRFVRRGGGGVFFKNPSIYFLVFLVETLEINTLTKSFCLLYSAINNVYKLSRFKANILKQKGKCNILLKMCYNLVHNIKCI